MIWSVFLLEPAEEWHWPENRSQLPVLKKYKSTLAGFYAALHKNQGFGVFWCKLVEWFLWVTRAGSQAVAAEFAPAGSWAVWRHKRPVCYHKKNCSLISLPVAPSPLLSQKRLFSIFHWLCHKQSVVENCSRWACCFWAGWVMSHVGNSCVQWLKLSLEDKLDFGAVVIYQG